MKFVRRTFRTPEIMVALKCDVHPSERAWVGVVDHPFFAVSDASAAFEIRGLPAGRYTIEAWHERYASSRAEVIVKAGGEAVLDVKFSKKK